MPPPSRSSANAVSHSMASFHHFDDASFEVLVEQVGLFLARDFTTSNAKAMWALSSRNTQFVPPESPCKRPRERKK